MTALEPVRLADHQPTWARTAAGAAAYLSELLPGVPLEHIGSTAVAGLVAKPVVDLIAGVADEAAIEPASRACEANGYVLEGQCGGHAWLCWPSPEGRQVIVHVVVHGGREWAERLLFRDRLRADEWVRQEYGELKRLLEAQNLGLTAYTAAKRSFVTRVLGNPPAG